MHTKIGLDNSATGSWLDVNDNHQVRTLEGKPPKDPRPVGDAFREWLEFRADRDEFGSQPYPVFLVAAEGGGLRAAYFTALVLEELQAKCPRFAQHTFLISGVSGGSVGASLFAQALNHNRARNKSELPCSMQADPPGGAAPTRLARHALRADLLSPLLWGLLITDFVQWFVPVRFEILDRARRLEGALELAWEDATGGEQLDEVSFYTVWQGVTGAVPALVLNTTNAETGHRMVVSHIYFPGREMDLPALADVSPGLNIRLSTAAVLSARFPLITPAGTVPVPPGHDGSEIATKRRYVDGGYFDNSGLTTILNAVEALQQEAAAGHVRLVIISIETSAAITSYGDTEAEGPSNPEVSFGELLSPLRALLNTWQALGNLAKLETERVVERLNECVTEPCVAAEIIRFTVGPGDVPMPLGWDLSEDARLELERQLRVRNGLAVSRVLQHLRPERANRRPVVTLEDVLFDVNDAAFQSSAPLELLRLVEYLKRNADRKILLEGHTDSTGSSEYNLQLSQLRAQSVESFLVSNGVPADRVRAIGYGETSPEAPNDSATGRQQNRRVKIVILDAGDSFADVAQRFDAAKLGVARAHQPGASTRAVASKSAPGLGAAR